MLLAFTSLTIIVVVLAVLGFFAYCLLEDHRYEISVLRRRIDLLDAIQMRHEREQQIGKREQKIAEEVLLRRYSELESEAKRIVDQVNDLAAHSGSVSAELAATSEVLQRLLEELVSDHKNRSSDHKNRSSAIERSRDVLQKFKLLRMKGDDLKDLSPAMGCTVNAPELS